MSQREDSVVADFRDRLHTAGLHGGLGFLNTRTRHRFTGVYRFDGPMLRCHCLFDRENPTIWTGGDLVLRDSYCGIVAESGSFFEIENALADPRLDTHPARGSMLAYQGVPLRRGGDARGFGSLCHWDVRPRLIAGSERAVLFAVAPLIASNLEQLQLRTDRAPTISGPSARQQAHESSPPQ